MPPTLRWNDSERLELCDSSYLIQPHNEGDCISRTRVRGSIFHVGILRQPPPCAKVGSTVPQLGEMIDSQLSCIYGPVPGNQRHWVLACSRRILRWGQCPPGHFMSGNERIAAACAERNSK